MGTGCGILGIIAASTAARVVAVDINPHAVQCAVENARLNRVANRMLFVQGSLFSPIRDETKFDLITFNAPYLPSEPSERGSWLELAWKGGYDGREIIQQFVREAPRFVKARGCIFLMQSTLADVDRTLGSLMARGLRAEVVEKRALPFFEDVVLLRAQNVGALRRVDTI